MDRYGEAICADLADRGFDLEQLWDERRFEFILAVVDHLPRNSAYMQALTDDEDWARAILARPDPDEPAPPSVRLADWSPELEMLTNLYDRLGELVRVVAMTGGGKPARPKPAPRPRTAIDRIRARQRKAKHARVVRAMLPHKATEAAPPAS
ncbi:hypothetical protein [Micromonospora chalcea]|uniref:hypothetical protein n=1 Tax=Micromonospora chalcea TaxID=1874 RepID=UPI003D74830D